MVKELYWVKTVFSNKKQRSRKIMIESRKKMQKWKLIEGKIWNYKKRIENSKKPKVVWQIWN